LVEAFVRRMEHDAIDGPNRLTVLLVD